MREKQETKYVEVVGAYQHQTDKALCIKVAGRSVWIPKSQIQDGYDAQTNRDEEITVVITEWIADKLGVN